MPHLPNGSLWDIMEIAIEESERRHKKEGFDLGVKYGEIRAAFRGYVERRDLLLREDKQEKIDAFYDDLRVKAERARQIEQEHPEVFDPGPTKLSAIYEKSIEPDRKRFASLPREAIAQDKKEV